MIKFINDFTIDVYSLQIPDFALYAIIICILLLLLLFAFYALRRFTRSFFLFSTENQGGKTDFNFNFSYHHEP